MPASRATRRLAGEFGLAIRHHPEDTERIEALRLAWKEQALADRIHALADTAPPLTATQRRRLAVVLMGGGADA